MDKDVAREIIRQVFRSEKELTSLLPMLKERCSEQDYVEWARQVASAIDWINVDLLNRVLARFPELETEIDDNLRRTGKAMP
jgi:hypothetical protein